MKYLKLLACATAVFLLPLFASGQESAEEPVHTEDSQIAPIDAYYKGQIIEIPKTADDAGTGELSTQKLLIRILDGDQKGQMVTIENAGTEIINGGEAFKVGDKVVIHKTTYQSETNYYIEDIYRFPALMWATLIFIAVALVFSRWRGFASILGLAITVAVIVKFVAPRVVAGHDPLLTCLIAALLIGFIPMFLAHGFNKRTSIALASTVLTLIITVGLAAGFVHFSKLFGNGSEESLFLQIDPNHQINMQGLLLGAIILGALGVLDDITTAQSAVVDELKKANPKLGFKELYVGGLSVGREHIASLINTLFLAYAGASLPLFLLLNINSGTPIWALLNSEFIAEEIIRTLVGSIALILAVPITTLLAAWFSRHTQTKREEVYALTNRVKV